MIPLRALVVTIALGLVFTTWARQVAAEPQRPTAATRGCDDLYRLPGLVWRGTGGTMTLQQLASYAAPVFWPSPDEPTLKRARGRDIRVPAAFPFEPQPESPVVYYQVTMLATLPEQRGPAIELNALDKGQSVLHLDNFYTLKIKYVTYFPSEAGVGEHLHDVEPSEFRILVGRANGPLARSAGFRCDDTSYLIAVGRVTGEAHGNPWYYNVLDVDAETTLPIHLLIEEGKHAAATDKNADGYFTPGYDVSARVNDAWGVRDTIRGGTLFSGKFEAWMAKARKPEHLVLPPLPADSPLNERLLAEAGDPATHAVYELRPYPSSALATTDAPLRHKISEKEVKNWPVIEHPALPQVRDVLTEGRELKPFSVSYRNDGQPGLSVAFPLLVVKNVREPLSGGYLVNRMYFKDTNLRDWAWMVMYTPSASRWFDEYLAAGMETDREKRNDGSITKARDFVAETGLKLRFKVRTFGGPFPDFWGFRAGVKSVGGFDIERLSFVIEFGAGVW